MSAGVILLAAGSGQRFGGRVSKQFLLLKKTPLLLYSFRAFVQSSCVREIVVVVAADKISLTERLLKKEKSAKVVRVVAGGSFRGESVKHGYLGLSKNYSVVLVHDAARPLVTLKIVQDVYSVTLKKGAALAAWPLSDTLKMSSEKAQVKKTIPRKNLWLAQTPQGFSDKVAKRCLLHPVKSATDDVALAERKGIRVAVVPASPTNIKVTYPTDLKIVNAFLSS